MVNVAVIIARADRRGMTDHHLQSVRGVPLLGRAIRTCHDAFTIDRVYVTTDSERIASVAESHGARVLRLPRGATADTTSGDEALLAVLDDIPDATTLAVVSAKHPFLGFRDIDHAVKLVTASHWDSVFAAVPDTTTRWILGEDGATEVPTDPAPSTSEQVVADCGAMYVFRRDGFEAAKNRLHGRIGVVEIPARQALAVITPDDLQLARELSAQGEVRQAPSPVDAVVSDFTGLYTDGYVTVGSNETATLRLHHSDLAGATLLTDSGVKVMALTPRRDALITAQAKKIGINLVVAKNKIEALTTWLTKNNLDASRVVYVGNDRSDRECMEAVGWPVATHDAHPEITLLARLTLASHGGRGAIRELAELIQQAPSTEKPD